MVGPATLNQSLRPGRVQLISIKVSQPSMIIALASTGGDGTQYRLTLVVDSRGLIGGLDSGPVSPAPVPTTWAGVDATLRGSVASAEPLGKNPGVKGASSAMSGWILGRQPASSGTHDRVEANMAGPRPRAAWHAIRRHAGRLDLAA